MDSKDEKDREKKEEKQYPEEDEEDDDGEGDTASETGDNSDEGDEEEEAVGLLDDLKSLLFQQRLSDVVFVVGSDQERVPAHKLILAASSPIFALMVYPTPATVLSLKAFDDRGSLEIHLPTTNLPTFKLLLEAIYTDEAELDAYTIGDCIKLAKKYCCEKFQLLCSDFLSDCLTVENACRMYNSALETLGDANFGVDFLLKNGKKCMFTQGFTQLKKDR